MTHLVPSRAFLVATILLIALATSCNEQDAGPPGPSGQGSPPVPQGLARLFLGLLTDGLESTYRVTYQTTTPEGASGGTTVVFNKPPRTRIDTIPPGSSQPWATIIRGDEDAGTASCSGGPDWWECFEIEPLGESLLAAAGPFVFPDAADVATYDVSEAGARTIAGLRARCFRLVSREAKAGGEIEYCFNEEGIPLYGAPLFGTVEATDFTIDVSDDEFALPADLQR